MKRCINCKHIKRYKSKDNLGICRKYGFIVKDSLSGCEVKKLKQEGEKK